LRRILGTIIKPPSLKEDDWLRLSSEKLGIEPSMFRASANSGSAAKFADQDIDDFKGSHSTESDVIIMPFPSSTVTGLACR